LGAVAQRVENADEVAVQLVPTDDAFRRGEELG
jgi:hypothetical protein